MSHDRRRPFAHRPAIAAYFAIPTLITIVAVPFAGIRDWVDSATTSDWILHGEWSGHTAQILTSVGIWVLRPRSSSGSPAPCAVMPIATSTPPVEVARRCADQVAVASFNNASAVQRWSLIRGHCAEKPLTTLDGRGRHPDRDSESEHRSPGDDDDEFAVSASGPLGPGRRVLAVLVRAATTPATRGGARNHRRPCRRRRSSRRSWRPPSRPFTRRGEGTSTSISAPRRTVRGVDDGVSVGTRTSRGRCRRSVGQVPGVTRPVS